MSTHKTFNRRHLASRFRCALRLPSGEPQGVSAVVGRFVVHATPGVEE